MRENWTVIQFWEIRMVLLRHEVSYDIDSLKPAKTTCPLPLAFLWFSHSLRMTKGRRRRMKRQLLFIEMSGIATVTPGHSHSIRYHTQSLNSWERTEVGRPVKPFGIPLRPDLRGPPALPTQNNSKVVNPSARFPCHTHCFHDASDFLRCSRRWRRVKRKMSREAYASACALALIPSLIRSSSSCPLNLLR